MEYGSRVRFVIFTILALLLLGLSAWGIISLSNRLFGSNQSSQSSAAAKINLQDYIKYDTKFSLESQGPVVADELYVSSVIEVAQDYRQITIYRGYGKTIISQKRYENNNAAYDAFVKSLELVGFSKTIAGISSNETGNCPTAQRFVYMLNSGNQKVIRTWSTTCSSKAGSFGGNALPTRALFRAQIPDYLAMTTGLAVQ